MSGLPEFGIIAWPLTPQDATRVAHEHLSTSAPINLTVRTLRSVDDLVRAQALYHAYGGMYLPVPDVDLLYEAMKEEQLFACWHSDGRLVGVGGTFWVGRCCHSEGPPIAVYELAGLVVHPELRGLRPYGIQDVLVAVRTAALASQQATRTCVISSVAAGNNASRKSMIRCGLVELNESQVPRWLRDVRRTWLPGREPDVVNYIAPPVSLRRQRVILDGVAKLPLSSKPGDDSAMLYRIRLAHDPTLDDVAELEDALPSWSGAIPPRRLLGSEPPFVPWPR